MWQSMVDLLSMVGDHCSQLDGLRLYLPLELRRSLGETLFEPWIISPWIERCLRVVPAVLWQDYLKLIRRQVADDEAIQNLIIRPARRLESKADDTRWHLSGTQAARVGIQSRDSCWICPNAAWLEIWKGSTKLELDRRRAETLAKHLEVIQPSRTLPPTPSSAADSDPYLCADHRTMGKSSTQQHEHRYSK